MGSHRAPRNHHQYLQNLKYLQYLGGNPSGKPIIELFFSNQLTVNVSSPSAISEEQ